MAKLIKIKNLSYQQGRFCLKIADLHFNQTQSVCVIGPSGSGKSTLLRLIAGLVAPTTGHIEIYGSHAILPLNQRRVMLLQQQFGLWPHLTVIQHIAFMRNGGQTIKSTPADETILVTVHLLDKKDKLPEQLSGGEQQRLALARVLATVPEILLLDEPFSNIDLVLQYELRGLVKQYCKQHQISLIQVTHLQDDFQQDDTQVVVLENGRLIQQGKWAQIIQQPVSQWIQTLTDITT